MPVSECTPRRRPIAAAQPAAHLRSPSDGLLQNRGAVIAFATLVLGLVTGEVRVDLLVADAVAAVELRLDGELCERRERPPWSLGCDLGAELAPHRLTALAFDAAGAELGRAEQTLNADARDAGISLVLDRAADGRALLRIAAASPAGAPREVAVAVDGVPLPVTDLSLVALPALDLAQPHLVRVEARWSERVTAAVDAVLGGEHGGELATELTAVPVRSHGRRAPAPAELAGALRSGGRPLSVVAVDAGRGELWVVTDPRVLPLLARRVPGARARTSIGGLDWRFVGMLGHGDDLRLVWPWPQRQEVDGRLYELFLPSPAMAAREGGVPWLLYRARLPPLGVGPPRLADAAAVAGMALAAGERRRALLVLLDGAPRDEGQLEPAAVRRYLERLRVPLYVWRLERWRGAAPDPWAPARGIANSRELLLALDEVAAELRRQRVAWVHGSFLPTEIETAGELALTGPAGAGAGASPLVADEEGDAARDLEAAALAEALAREAGARRTALEAALAGGERGAARGVELRLASGTGVSVGELERTVSEGARRWEELTAIRLPALDGTVLAVFAHLDEHPALARRVAGLAARGHAAFGAAVLEIGGRSADEVEALALHELAHLLAERVFARPLPVWLEEGLAEHLARRRLDAADGLPARRGEIVVERDVRGVVTHARGPLADLSALARAAERGELEALADWTGLSWREFVDPERRGRHYALAGELVGFLLATDAERAGRFRNVLARAAGDPELDVESELAAALGDAAALDAAFRAWLRAERDQLVTSVR